MEGVRLPNYIVPVTYQVALEFSLDEDYSGSVALTLDFKQPSSNFWFHAVKPVEVVSIHFKGQSLEFEAAEHDAFAVEIGEPVSGLETFEIKFRSKVNNVPKGFFFVKTSLNEFVFTCQFEPTYARYALPCLDEPALKAKFTLQVTIPEGEYFVISNMLPSITAHDGLKTYSFQESPVMPTYLLHWSVVNHQSISTVSSKGVSLTLYMPRTETSQYFLDLGQNCLDFYIDYFQIPYPLTKLDMIGFMDLGFRAMENWGAITFLEHILEWDDSKDIETTVRNCRTTCHEIAHMWFGNLVTMEWWDDLWLNEGFARFMEHKALNALRPEFDVWTRFARYVKEAAMDSDASPKTHSIVQHVTDPDEIKDKFDLISYGKGGSVLRMCEAIVGEEVFKLGVQDYLNSHLYSNTTTDDLWRSIHKFSEVDPAEIMHDWITKPSFPLVKLTRTPEGEFSVSQTSFYVVEEGATWLVPLQYQDSEGTVQLFIFNTQQASLPIPAGSRAPKLNHLGRGFYKVQYEGDLLIEVFEHYSSYQVEDRYELVSDLFQLYAQRLYSLEQVLNSVEFIVNETNYVILSRIQSFLTWLWNTLNGQFAFPQLVQHLARKLLGASYDSLSVQELHGDSQRAFSLCGDLLDRICGSSNNEEQRPENVRDVVPIEVLEKNYLQALLEGDSFELTEAANIEAFFRLVSKLFASADLLEKAVAVLTTPQRLPPSELQLYKDKLYTLLREMKEFPVEVSLVTPVFRRLTEVQQEFDRLPNIADLLNFTS
mmetsp:Transcript_19944/g.36885  ORF Transcript_19944/g.36885 Transcript_19944/m.36885 type:complete len:766 (+) Transcript_19944:4708-7005(+)